jgi:NAD(P)-dependent dehydrogenase (short-subunit alcohol dehydrogenase family)
MSVKSAVSAAYTAEQLTLHGSKPIRLPPRVLITGDHKVGSIGAAIHFHLQRSEAQVFSLVCDVRFDRLWRDDCDTLIMCHGVSHLDWFEEAPEEKVKEIIDVNLFGTYRMAAQFVQQTINSAVRKRIIIIGSMAHRMVLNGSAAYCASKAGLAMLVRCMAWELAPKGYDVYCIHPSNTLGTPMSFETIEGLQRYRGLTSEQAASYWNDSAIRESSLTVTEIAELVLFLLYSETGYLSGTQLELAGGQR